MARSEARLSVSIWTDPDFLALPPGAQRMFMFLISQPDLAHDGVIALRERRWSTSAAGLSRTQITGDLEELHRTRFVVVDWEAEELLVRSFIRRDKVYRQPNVLRAAADHLAVVTSPAIRHALAVELERIAALDEKMPADTPKILEEMRAALPDPSRNPPPNPSRNPSGDRGEPLPEPSPNGTHDRAEDVTGVIRSEVIEPSLSDITAGDKGSGNPSGMPTPGTPGERGVVTAVSRGFPGSPFLGPPAVPPPAGASLALVPPLDEAVAEPPDSTQTLIAEWLDHCRKRPPRGTIAQIGKHIKALLAEGIDPADVRAGLAAWFQKGSAPSALPSFVNQAMNAPGTARAAPRASGDIDWQAAMRRAEAKEGR